MTCEQYFDSVCNTQINNWELGGSHMKARTLPEESTQPAALTHDDKQSRNMRNGPENTLVYKSFVHLNPPGVVVVWEGNDLGKLKCTGT